MYSHPKIIVAIRVPTPLESPGMANAPSLEVLGALQKKTKAL